MKPRVGGSSKRKPSRVPSEGSTKRRWTARGGRNEPFQLPLACAGVPLVLILPSEAPFIFFYFYFYLFEG